MTKQPAHKDFRVQILVCCKARFLWRVAAADWVEDTDKRKSDVKYLLYPPRKPINVRYVPRRGEMCTGNAGMHAVCKSSTGMRTNDCRGMQVGRMAGNAGIVFQYHLVVRQNAQSCVAGL